MSEAGRYVGLEGKSAPSNAFDHARDDNLILPIDDNGWRLAKLARILSHLDLAFSTTPSEAELVDLCLQAETKAIALLADLEKNRVAKNPADIFRGGTILDLSRHVLRRLFEQVSDDFEKKSAAEKDRIARELASLLAGLPPEVQEKIRQQAGVSDLSHEALMRTGTIAGIGAALSGIVGFAGFSAYTALTSFVASTAGLIGVTLPFGVYTGLTSGLAMLTNPLVLGAGFLVFGGVMVSGANARMRNQLAPVMVATAVVASTEIGDQIVWPEVFSNRLVRAYGEREAGEARQKRRIDCTFPCLPKRSWFG
jgi:hypothetical protein